MKVAIRLYSNGSLFLSWIPASKCQCYTELLRKGKKSKVSQIIDSQGLGDSASLTPSLPTQLRSKIVSIATPHLTPTLRTTQHQSLYLNNLTFSREIRHPAQLISSSLKRKRQCRWGWDCVLGELSLPSQFGQHHTVLLCLVGIFISTVSRWQLQSRRDVSRCTY